MQNKLFEFLKTIWQKKEGELETRVGGCAGCGNCADGKKAHCPNCGYGNPVVYEERDFEFIEKLKVKLGLKSENGA